MSSGVPSGNGRRRGWRCRRSCRRGRSLGLRRRGCTVGGRRGQVGRQAARHLGTGRVVLAQEACAGPFDLTCAAMAVGAHLGEDLRSGFAGVEVLPERRTAGCRSQQPNRPHQKMASSRHVTLPLYAAALSGTRLASTRRPIGRPDPRPVPAPISSLPAAICRPSSAWATKSTCRAFKCRLIIHRGRGICRL